MSGTFPSTPGFRSTTLRSHTGILVARAVSGRVQVRDTGRHTWSFSVAFTRLTREKFAPVWAFVRAQRGQYGSFTIVLPDLATPRGVATGSPLVNGGSQSGATLNISGCTPSITAWMKAGDIFKLAGHSKVYQLTADANSNGSGLTTLTFEPPLFATPATGEALTVINVPFTAMLASDVQEYDTDTPLRFTYEIDMEERL